MNVSASPHRCIALIRIQSDSTSPDVRSYPRRDPDMPSEKSDTTNVACPNCASLLRLTSQLQGRCIRCLSCRSVLRIEAAAARRWRKPAGLTAEVVVSVMPCPQCGNPFRLVSGLHGRRIRCTACRGLLTVSAQPWSLTPVRMPEGSPEREGSAQESSSPVRIRGASPQPAAIPEEPSDPGDIREDSSEPVGIPQESSDPVGLAAEREELRRQRVHFGGCRRGSREGRPRRAFQARRTTRSFGGEGQPPSRDQRAGP